ISSRAVTKAVNAANRLYTAYTVASGSLTWEELNTIADEISDTDIGMIGGSDSPTAIFITSETAKEGE
ncbi:MAG: hypothetical protein IJ639_07780, partial [Ruminococcus sp.]|nr:hypothetical protein [Ruminococcus sp.]